MSRILVAVPAAIVTVVFIDLGGLPFARDARSYSKAREPGRSITVVY